MKWSPGPTGLEPPVGARDRKKVNVKIRETATSLSTLDPSPLKKKLQSYFNLDLGIRSKARRDEGEVGGGDELIPTQAD